MSMLEVLALAVIVAASLYLIVLGVSALIVPAQASRFLLGFAGSLKVHLVELSVRMVVGLALLIYAQQMFAPEVFELLGWMLIATTALLVVLPWRWHRQFAELAVPRAVRYMSLIGPSSLIFGALILAAVIRGSAS